MSDDEIDASFRALKKVMHRQDNHAGDALERICELIELSQSGIGEDVAVGISVAGSGTTAPFRLRSLQASNPDILVFNGVDEKGNVIQLIQHCSQVSVLLVAVPKLDEKPFRIGFT